MFLLLSLMDIRILKLGRLRAHQPRILLLDCYMLTLEHFSLFTVTRFGLSCVPLCPNLMLLLKFWFLRFYATCRLDVIKLRNAYISCAFKFVLGGMIARVEPMMYRERRAFCVNWFIVCYLWQFAAIILLKDDFDWCRILFLYIKLNVCSLGIYFIHLLLLGEEIVADCQKVLLFFDLCRLAKERFFGWVDRQWWHQFLRGMIVIVFSDGVKDLVIAFELLV